MTDIVIRALSKEEAHDLRMLKAQLDEPTWRALFLRLIKEWKTYQSTQRIIDNIGESEHDEMLKRYDGRD